MAKIEFTPRVDAVFPSEDAPGEVDAAFGDCDSGKRHVDVTSLEDVELMDFDLIAGKRVSRAWRELAETGRFKPHIVVEAEVDRVLGILPVALAVLAAVCA